ncbi:MAG: DNA recombination protein RmuC [Gammaproteobacteria bacterium]|nr:DNA recombination protein RmuC [Gammaproteobacteria bacterium]MDH3768712.1 DNA recombination protein RmuC [Gammaproteobacteria bacterium]
MVVCNIHWIYSNGYLVQAAINNELIVAAIAGLLLGLVLGALVTSVLYLRKLAQLEADREILKSSLKSQEELAAERASSLETAAQSLRVAFDELAGKSLSTNSETFLRLARENLGQYQTQAKAELSARQQAITEIVKPITETLTSTREQLQRAEKERLEAFGAIDQQLKQVLDSHGLLQVETNKLVNALQRPDVGGQWGEITLRRLVELAGMVEHCDFVEQKSVTTDEVQFRPDLVVRLPDRGEIIVDAKTPMEGYLAAAQATDDVARKEALTRHATNVRRRVRELAGKNYWAQFKHSPEFVVMFVPGDQFLGAALNQDPALLEDALKQRILLVTPTSLIALLKSVAYGWRQSVLTDNAEKIRDLAEELFKRLAGFTEHVATLGSALNKSVDTYNRAVGSLERQVLPQARKFTEMGITERKKLAAVEPIDKTARNNTAEPVAKPVPKDAG